MINAKIKEIELDKEAFTKELIAFCKMLRKIDKSYYSVGRITLNQHFGTKLNHVDFMKISIEMDLFLYRGKSWIIDRILKLEGDGEIVKEKENV